MILISNFKCLIPNAPHKTVAVSILNIINGCLTKVMVGVRFKISGVEYISYYFSEYRVKLVVLNYLRCRENYSPTGPTAQLRRLVRKMHGSSSKAKRK